MDYTVYIYDAKVKQVLINNLSELKYKHSSTVFGITLLYILYLRVIRDSVSYQGRLALLGIKISSAHQRARQLVPQGTEDWRKHRVQLSSILLTV
ncbi:hypothetical protein RRG08_022301 [Elysia crispata]|uniref:Uncharacterized protein n=1 Tax=Elysia crispata TaxID=231223 RepID=A0AAE0ZS46_9GAST|nr:hypothetical protein RRG08_022301 [Elysia crispata]